MGFKRLNPLLITIITHSISEALARKYIFKTIALNIPKTFDKSCHKLFLLNLSSYGITERDIIVTKSFLMSLKLVGNGQSFGVLEINANISHDSLLGPTLFLIYINYL